MVLQAAFRGGLQGSGLHASQAPVKLATSTLSETTLRPYPPLDVYDFIWGAMWRHITFNYIKSAQVKCCFGVSPVDVFLTAAHTTIAPSLRGP